MMGCMANDLTRRLAKVFCGLLMAAGFMAMPVGITISREGDGPLPSYEVLAREKAIGTTVLLCGGGVAALSAVGLYLIDKKLR